MRRASRGHSARLTHETIRKWVATARGRAVESDLSEALEGARRRSAHRYLDLRDRSAPHAARVAIAGAVPEAPDGDREGTVALRLATTGLAGARSRA